MELGYCEDTDLDWLMGVSPAAMAGSGPPSPWASSTQWTDPLGIYVRLCDRLLEPSTEGAPKAIRRTPSRDRSEGAASSEQGGSGRELHADPSAKENKGRELYVELQLDLSELVQLAGAVAKAGMGGHPVMNAVSNALTVQLEVE